MFWHTARDDIMFTSMRCVSRHEKTQVYGVILPQHLTNQAMLESIAYQTYYAYATGEKALQEKYVQKKAKSDTSPKKNTAPASKGSKLKSSAKVAKTYKKKQHAKIPKTKGLDVLTESKVPNEQQQKVSGITEGAGVRPEVLDVPKYDSKSDEEYWTFKEEEENKEGEDKDIEGEKEKDEEDDLYRDVNINLKRSDAKMTNAQEIKTRKILISDIQKNLYNALIESYNFDKDIITSYGDVVTLKRGRDDQDKDEDPSVGSKRGSKRRRSCKKL
nr:hypothetical protein [Tanacetum cinerariifolium]